MLFVLFILVVSCNGNTARATGQLGSDMWELEITLDISGPQNEVRGEFRRRRHHPQCRFICQYMPYAGHPAVLQ